MPVRQEPHGTQMMVLSVKLVVADGHNVRARGGDPHSRGEGRIEKVQRASGDGISLQTSFGGDDGRRNGVLINGAVGNGRELNAVFLIEYDILDRVREGGASFAVQNHVTHGDLSCQRLAFGFRRNDAGQPVEIGAVVIFRSPGDGGGIA